MEMPPCHSQRFACAFRINYLAVYSTFQIARLWKKEMQIGLLNTFLCLLDYDLFLSNCVQIFQVRKDKRKIPFSKSTFLLQFFFLNRNRNLRNVFYDFQGHPTTALDHTIKSKRKLEKKKILRHLVMIRCITAGAGAQ